MDISLQPKDANEPPAAEDVFYLHGRVWYVAQPFVLFLFKKQHLN